MKWNCATVLDFSFERPLFKHALIRFSLTVGIHRTDHFMALHDILKRGAERIDVERSVQLHCDARVVRSVAGFEPIEKP